MVDLEPNSTFQLLSPTACEPVASGLLVILRFGCIFVSQGKGTPGNVTLLSSTHWVNQARDELWLKKLFTHAHTNQDPPQLPPKQAGSVLPGGSTTPQCIQTPGQALFSGSELTVSLCVLLLLIHSSPSGGCLHSNASLDPTWGFYRCHLAQAASQYPAMSLSILPAVSNNALV